VTIDLPVDRYGYIVWISALDVYMAGSSLDRDHIKTAVQSNGNTPDTLAIHCSRLNPWPPPLPPPQQRQPSSLSFSGSSLLSSPALRVPAL
jgi:hypothetical protein